MLVCFYVPSIHNFSSSRAQGYSWCRGMTWKPSTLSSTLKERINSKEYSRALIQLREYLWKPKCCILRSRKQIRAWFPAPEVGYRQSDLLSLTLPGVLPTPSPHVLPCWQRGWIPTLVHPALAAKKKWVFCSPVVPLKQLLNTSEAAESGAGWAAQRQRQPQSTTGATC